MVREQEHYKNPANGNGWKRPPVEEVNYKLNTLLCNILAVLGAPTIVKIYLYAYLVQVLAKLSTHFVKVHSRQCVDDFELAEHVVGLTGSLASCQFRYFVYILVCLCVLTW